MIAIVAERVKLWAVVGYSRDYYENNQPEGNKINDNFCHSLLCLYVTVAHNLDMINPWDERLCFCDIFLCKVVLEPIIFVLSCFLNLGGKGMKMLVSTAFCHRLIDWFSVLKAIV